MLACYDIRIDNSKMKQRISIDEVARDKEIARLLRFFNNTYGGILLLGGDRGSGKTKLIEMAIKKYQHGSRAEAGDSVVNFFTNPRRLTRSKLVKVNIPLIILDKKEQKNIQEVYRSLMMRAMLIGLEADLQGRHIMWLDLPKRWFRSIGYVQKVYSLKPYARYLTLSKTTSKALNGPSGLPIAPALQSAFSAEIDLTDSTIEIKLRELLSQYSKIHDFIFIFDELDKLPEDIRLESIVLYLKNLFSETGVHAIFVSSEQDLKRVVEKSSPDHQPPKEESTLFADLVLLNNMNIDEFTKIVKARVSDLGDNNLDELLYALALRTNRSPHELNKFFTRHGYSYPDLIHGLKTELGGNRFSWFSVLQVLIEYVYKKYCGLYGENYDRILHEALQQTGTIILESGSRYVNRIQTDSIFYTTNYFRRDDISNEQALENERIYKKNREEYVPDERPEMLSKVHGLNGDQSISIMYAIECLFVLMNRLGILGLASTDSQEVVEIKRINRDMLKHNVVKKETLDNAFDLKAREEKMAEIVEKFNPAYLAITEKNIYDPILFLQRNDMLGIEKVAGKFSFANSSVMWDQVRKLAPVARRSTLTALIDKISITTNSPIDPSWVEYRDHAAIVTLPTGKRLRVVMLYKRDRYDRDEGLSKTFVLRDKSATFNPGRDRLTKNITMNSDWRNVTRAVNLIADWINLNS